MNRILALLIVVSFLSAEVYAHPGEQTDCPQQRLDKIDPRVPVPLLPHMALHQKQNMREHLEAVQGVTIGIANSDFNSIALAASRMGYTEEMASMCQHMGAGAKGFTEKALSFHKSADRIADAAKQKDMNGVLRQLSETLTHCTSCHTTFRQQIVTDSEMRRILGGASH